MGTCGSCGSGVRSLLSRKLGRCPRCMRAAAAGTVAAWVTAGALYVLWPHAALVGVAVVLAGSVSLLLLAHLVAFLNRMTRRWEQLRDSAPREVREAWPGRRVFLRSLVGMTVAAFLPSAFGWRAMRGGGAFVEAAELEQAAYGCTPELALKQDGIRSLGTCTPTCEQVTVGHRTHNRIVAVECQYQPNYLGVPRCTGSCGSAQSCARAPLSFAWTIGAVVAVRHEGATSSEPTATAVGSTTQETLKVRITGGIPRNADNQIDVRLTLTVKVTLQCTCNGSPVGSPKTVTVTETFRVHSICTG